jgi:hypothetical protein
MARGGSKKGERRGGRQKGTTNKLSGDVKAMILKALDMKGGADYLIAQADLNPVAFMGLVGKVLPMTVVGDPDNPTHTKVEVTYRIVDPKEA